MGGLIRLLKSYLRPYSVEVTVVVILLLIQSIRNLYLPNPTADIINNGVAKGDIGYIWRIGGVMLALTIVVGILAIIAVYYASRASMGLGRDVRRGVFERVQQFSAHEMNRFGTASLITRNTNDVQQVQMFVQLGLTLLVAAPLMVIGGMLIFAAPLFQSMQLKIDRINQVMREQITGVRVIRAFNRGAHEADRFAMAHTDLDR